MEEGVINEERNEFSRGELEPSVGIGGMLVG